MFCTQCGQQNASGSRFCARCGEPVTEPGGGADRPADATSTLSLHGVEPTADHGSADEPELGTGTLAQVEALPAGTALLVVKRGPNAGSRFLLDTPLTTAGRHPESDIFLDDVTVSRRHAEFVREANGFLVRDVGSLNGTYVNRERIEAVALAGGDEVQVGKYRLVFLVGEAAR